ncbi:mCG144542, partial [Mus musculus]
GLPGLLVNCWHARQGRIYKIRSRLCHILHPFGSSLCSTWLVWSAGPCWDPTALTPGLIRQTKFPYSEEMTGISLFFHGPPRLPGSALSGPPNLMSNVALYSMSTHRDFLILFGCLFFFDRVSLFFSWLFWNSLCRPG